MPRYDFACAVCRLCKELDVKLKDMPAIGERYEVKTDSLACACGCRAYIRVMDEKGPMFKMNFRRTTP